jgi:hypothetical protein
MQQPILKHYLHMHTDGTYCGRYRKVILTQNSADKKLIEIPQ